MPAAAAAATFAGRSSMKTVASARRPYSLEQVGEDARVRLGHAELAEMTMPSNQPRKSKRARAMGNVSAHQLLKA